MDNQQGTQHGAPQRLHAKLFNYWRGEIVQGKKLISLFNLPFIYTVINKTPVEEINTKQFNEWFSGFVDAEGNFQVYLDRIYLRIKFRITLHIDDTEVLYIIQKKLGVGTVRVQDISSNYEISKLEEIKSILIPILESNPLRTRFGLFRF